jgi:hypothetical protein
MYGAPWSTMRARSRLAVDPSRRASGAIREGSPVEHALSPLAAWESFYVIVGSSAAALTGLQFVVIVLGADLNRLAGSSMKAFATPTIVHFCAVLLIAGILSAPWHALTSAALALGLCGAAGLAYGIVVVRHARRQTGYTPVLEDWIWHSGLPIAVYASLLVTACFLPFHVSTALFVIGGAALLLLFVAIHNAWDAVTYIALTGQRAREEEARAAEPLRPAATPPAPAAVPSKPEAAKPTG